MNDNQKEALKIFLEYIFKENENNKEIEKIVENYVSKKLKNYFDIVANKIDEIDNETSQLRKEVAELYKVDDKDLVKLDENKKSVNFKPITGNSSEVKQSTKKSKKRQTTTLRDEKVLRCIPEMTNTEADEYFKRVRSKCGKLSQNDVKKILVRDATSSNIAKKLNLTKATVNNALKNIKNRDDIRFIPVNEMTRATIVYVKIIPDDVADESPKSDAAYQFKQRYNNVGFELINNLYIKSKGGKRFDINAKQLKKLSQMVDGEILTYALFDECCAYLSDCGVNSSSFECIIYHLVKGNFSMILYRYDEHLRQVTNPHFELYNGTLRVNGHDTKLKSDEVKKMLDNIPYGYSDDVLEKYVQELQDKYDFCPSECIRLIVDNYDDYQLKVLLKRRVIVENNPQKRREKGFI